MKIELTSAFFVTYVSAFLKSFTINIAELLIYLKNTLRVTPTSRLTTTQIGASEPRTQPFSAPAGKTRSCETRSNPGSRGHVREEGPPFGWRPEGLRPSNRLRPRRGGGGAPWRRGRGRGPVHHRVHGWRHLPHRCTLARRGRGGKATAGRGGAQPAEANPRGGARGRGWGHRPRPKHPSPGALWSRAAPRPSGARAGEPPPPLGTPPLWPRTSPLPPLLRRGECGDGCREARAAPPSPLPSSPHAPPVFPLSPLITAGWLGEEGRWPRRSLGGRLPLTRELPCEPEDGGGSCGSPGGGGTEARGAESGDGSRERQRPVAAHQNRNQRQPHSHLSRPSCRS